jgi:anti-anti-sigma factor
MAYGLPLPRQTAIASKAVREHTMFAHFESSGSDLRLRLYGALDGSGARALRANAAGAAFAAQGDLLLDLTGVDFIDNDGLGAVMFLFKQLAARRRRLRLVGVSDAWQARLRDLGLADLMAPAGPAFPLAHAHRRRRPGVVH